jgi:hypothetical protein
MESINSKAPRAIKGTYFIVFVYCPHPPLALKLGDDLARILHNNLIGLEGTIAADAISAICCLDDFDSNVILASGLGPVLQALEISVTALGTQPAVTVVTLIEHIAVLTVIITASVFRTHASGQLEVFVRFPETSGITNKDIWTAC